MIYVPVNSFGRVGMASSSYRTIFRGKLALAVSQYFVYVLSLVTDNYPSWISGREENGHRSYFMINICESMGPGQDQTHDQ